MVHLRLRYDAPAARFSFLMSIPVMLGASLLAFVDLFNDIDLLKRLIVPLAIGFLSSAIVGFLVIGWFVKFLSKRPLFVFASYCMGLGIVGSLYFG